MADTTDAPPDEPAQNKREQAATAARRRLLDAGLELMHERPVNIGLEHIRVTEVAKLAGMTTGAIYHHWENQDDYRRDLMAELLTPFTNQGNELLEAVSAIAASGELSLNNLIELASWDGVSQLANDQRFDVRIAFWTRRRDETIAANLREGYQRQTVRRAGIIDALMHAYDLEPIEGMTSERLATVIDALAEGLAMRHAVDPTAVPLPFPDIGDALASVRAIDDPAIERIPADADTEHSIDDHMVSRVFIALLSSLTKPRQPNGPTADTST